MCQCVMLWLLLVTLVAGISEEHQYCAIRYRRLCQGKGRHVACQYPDSGPGASCERYTQIRFTNELKHFITHYLNRRRQRIAVGNERVRGGVHLPKPQVMMLVEWDRELALLAQRLADQCHFVHDDCRATVKFPYAGQTVGEVRWRRSSDSDELSAQRAIRRVLDAWWGERRRVQPKQLTAPFRLTAKGTVWGHFSQLAVWNLQAVGCGAVRHGARHPRLLLVCDFSHTNMLGQRTLVPGAMAPCPMHTARRPRTAYPALCGPVRVTSPQDAEETEREDDYEDDEEGSDSDTSASEEIASPKLWQKKTNAKVVESPRAETHPPRTTVRTTARTVNTAYSIREFPEEIRKQESDIFRINPGEYVKPKTQFSLSVTPIAMPERESIRDNMDSVREQIREKGEKARKKAMFKQDPRFDLVDETRWPNKKNYFDGPDNSQWRYSPSNTNGKYNSNSDQEMEQVIPLTVAPPPPETKEPSMVDLYRPTMTEETTTELSETEIMYRPRWKQTRVRPQRPGAHAILYATTPKPTKKPAIASINLDKEDIDQLFRDTGFNLHWRKPST